MITSNEVHAPHVSGGLLLFISFGLSPQGVLIWEPEDPFKGFHTMSLLTR